MRQSPGDTASGDTASGAVATGFSGTGAAAGGPEWSTGPAGGSVTAASAAGAGAAGPIVSYSETTASVKPISDPPPARGRANTVPPWRSATSRTIDRPSPEPGRLRAFTDR